MSHIESTTVSESVAAGLRAVRLRTPVIDIKRLIVARLSTDVPMRTLLGIRAGIPDPRIYAYYQPSALVDIDHPAYVTYAQTGFPEQTQATGEPVFNLAVWAKDWEAAEAVRQRLVDLFDEKLIATVAGRDLFGTVIMQHDNYQEDTKFASVIVQVRFGFSRV